MCQGGHGDRIDEPAYLTRLFCFVAPLDVSAHVLKLRGLGGAGFDGQLDPTLTVIRHVISYLVPLPVIAPGLGNFYLALFERLVEKLPFRSQL